MAVTSLILGICALVFPFIGLGGFSFWISIVGIIFGALGRNDEDKRGMATAGLVLSIIALAIGLLMWIACAACVSSVVSSLA